MVVVTKTLANVVNDESHWSICRVDTMTVNDGMIHIGQCGVNVMTVNSDGMIRLSATSAIGGRRGDLRRDFLKADGLAPAASSPVSF